MEITIHAAALVKELDRCQRIAARKETIPALACARITADVGGVEFGATDLDVTLRVTTLVAQVEKPGVILVPARRLLEIAKTLAPETVVSI